MESIIIISVNFGNYESVINMIFFDDIAIISHLDS